MHRKNIVKAGKPLEKAKRALIMLHGRGANAADILSLTQYLKLDDFAILAPEATNHSWYPNSFMALPQHNQPWLNSALELVGDLVQELEEQGFSSESIYFLGFSQGACLSLEFATRNARKYGGVIAFTGGLIGDRIYRENYNGDFAGTPIFIGTSNPDPHIPVKRVQESALILEEMGAKVDLRIYKNMGHTINDDEIDLAKVVLLQ